MEQRSTQPNQTQHRSFKVGDRVRVVRVEDPESCVKHLEGTVSWVETVRHSHGICHLVGIGPGFYFDELEAVQ